MGVNINANIIGVKVSVGFINEYQTVYDSFTIKPTDIIASIQNNMISSWVTGGVFSFDFIFILRGHTNDNNESLINWANPGTFDGTAVSGPSFEALRGFTSDGLASYINSNMAPSTQAVKYTLTDAVFGVYSNTDIDENGIDIGTNSSRDSLLWCRNGNDVVIRFNTDAALTAINSESIGLFIVNRVTGSDDAEVWKDNVKILDSSLTPLALPTREFYILCQNAGIPATFSNKQLGLAFAGSGMTAQNVEDFTDPFLEYVRQTSFLSKDNLGRMLFIEMGQSNMEGRDGDDPLHTIVSGEGLFYDDVAESLSLLTNDRNDAVGGSHATYFAKRLHDRTGVEPVLVEQATGGTGLTVTVSANNWSATTGVDLRGNAVTATNKAIIETKIDNPIALWAQGDSDAYEMDNNPSYTKSIVKSAMQDVIDWWFGVYPNSYFLICQVGFRGLSDSTGYSDMRDILTEIVSENDRVYMTSTVPSTFLSLGYMLDIVHYNYKGLKVMGEDFADKVIDIMNF